MQVDHSRRKALSFIVGSVALAHSNTQARCPTDPLTICDVTQLRPVKVAGVAEIRGTDDVRLALKRWSGNVSIGGGRFSMGGQTAVRDGLQLNMRPMNELVAFDPVRRVARVQAGMRWRDLQAVIDPAELSVQTMQSYASFTVGGSVSVNCHGRYVGHGPVSRSVRALQIVLPDGEVVEASRQTNSELFHAAIGGYGGMGVVTEVELNLDQNFRIRRSTHRVALEDYPAWFVEKVQSDPKALLHNADLMPGAFDVPHCTTWTQTDDALTVEDRLTLPGKNHTKEALFLWAMTELPGGAALRRKIVVPLSDKPAVVWRNFEASLDVGELEPASRDFSTYVLQEFFVPETRFIGFARKMSKAMQSISTGTINVSIRHSPAENHVLMTWAQENVFSFVVYYKQRLSPAAQRQVGEWTRSMIELALSHGGTYYLPYQLHATQSQFQHAYPNWGKFKKLRQHIGATRFTNTMWSQYGV